MTKAFSWTLIVMTLLLSAEIGYSQAYNFSIYSVNEGLPHAQISDVIEASDGFIWIATSGAGVSRFDGHEFTTYDINHGLRDDYVNTVYEDSKKRIWVGTYYGGLSYLEGLETGWNQPTKNRNTTYTNLSPGDYRFELQGRSGQGAWSEDSFYEFSVEEPFWMKIWFWFLMLLLIVLCLMGMFRSYAKRLERERLSSLVDERTAHLLQAVKDKEILVKEIHHRVKNNLAMIIGLLELQATRSTDEKTINTLKDSILRIYSMSLVHEKLYSTDHLTNVDVKNYISDLINVISHSMNLDHQNITIQKKINSFTLSLDQGITCGLLINELVTNAIKHAFTGLDEGTICIEFEIKDKQKILTVTDDGNGFPIDFPGFGNLQHLEGTSLGLTLITTLTKQLNGTLESIPQEKGTKIRITF